MRALLVAVMCAGCYGDQLDSPPDAGDLADPRELVTLQFLADAVDLSGFPVYFQNADSTLATATRTDADGRARARMLPGGFVTIVLPNGSMFTYADVRGGDTLIVNRADNNTERKEIQVTLPPSPGANVYTLWTNCGATRLDADLIEQAMPQQAMLIGCGAISDIVVTASSTEPQPFGSNHSYLYRKDVPLDPSALTTFEDAFVPQIESEVAATAMNEPAPQVTFTQQLVRDRRDVGQARTITVDVVGSAASGRITKMFAPQDGLTLTRVVPQVLGLSGQTTIVWGPSDRETEVVLGERALRSYTTRPRLEPSSTSVQWNEETEGVVGELVMLELQWTPPGTQKRTWQILSPRTDAAIVRFPVLPVAEYRPLDDAWVTQLTTIAIDDDSVARTTLLGSWPGNDSWLADTDAGRADFRVLAPPFRN
ncbi:MAG: hypothetical protein ACKV2T_03655 [Kofleriaceae bacterium]